MNRSMGLTAAGTADKFKFLMCLQHHNTALVHEMQLIFRQGGDFCMSAQWTGELVGKMHIYHIKKKELAKRIGVTPEYVSKVLCGHRSPPDAEQRFRAALDALISAQSHSSTSRVQ